MKSYIVDTLSGIFALDESGNIINFLDFNDNNEKMADFYVSLDGSTVMPEIIDLFSELQGSGFDEFIFDNKKMKKMINQELNLDTSLEIYSLEFKNFRFNLETQLQNVGLSKSTGNIALKHKKINENIIKYQISQAGEQDDVAVVQIIETLETLKKSISLFSVRLREWYGLHFPELTDKVIEDNIILAKLVSILGHRDNYRLEEITNNFDLTEKRMDFLIDNASKSMGADIDLSIVKDYANQILNLNVYRIQLEEYLEDLMEKTAPNLKAIIGSLIGAKLITKAGSLRKLAFMPASRVQLLGAETALYRFLKTGKGIPKHGLIFQWNMIRGSKPWQRGKISRVVSGKIGLAAKIDYFKGGFIGDEISSNLTIKIKEIERKYPNPPKVQKKPVQKKGSGSRQKPRRDRNQGKKGRDNRR